VLITIASYFSWRLALSGSPVCTPTARRRLLAFCSPCRPRRDGGVGTHSTESRVHRLHGTAMSHFTLAFRHAMHVRGPSAALLSALSVLSGGPVSPFDTIGMMHTPRKRHTTDRTVTAASHDRKKYVNQTMLSHKMPTELAGEVTK
jgi:hypothetical protein